jgi:hypothetical protein
MKSPWDIVRIIALQANMNSLSGGSRCRYEGLTMMVAAFATMLLALICGWFGSRTLAVALFFGCLVLSIGLFLFEIYSPESGFRMPWIQTEIDATPQLRS